MHLLLVGLARGLQNRVIRVRVLSDAPTPFEVCGPTIKDIRLRSSCKRQIYICSYRLMDRLSGYGPDDEGSNPPGSTNGKRKLWKVFAVMSPQKDTLETALCTSTEIGYNGADLKSDVSARACGFESYLVRQWVGGLVRFQ